MKKSIFLLLLTMGGFAAVAQQQEDNHVKKDTVPGNQPANLGNAPAPAQAQQTFAAGNPGVSNVKWLQVSKDWWLASYVNNGQVVSRSYNGGGQSLVVALPVMETQLPENIIKDIVSKFGPDVYDITKIKDANGQDQYVVRVLENGRVVTQTFSGA